MEKNLAFIVKKFQKGKISKRDFLQNINHIILSIPQYKKCYDIDIRNEFYAHVISKIEKIILNYREFESVKFETWFIFVLKREFVNFIKKLLKKEKNINESINEIILNEINQYKKVTFDNNNEISYPDISLLTEKEMDIVAYKYGINIENRVVMETTNKILEKIEKKYKIEQRITRRYFKIINLQKEILGVNDMELKNKLKKKIMQLMLFKRKLEKKLSGYSVLPSNRWVGEQLGLKAGTISAYLHKIKSKLLKNYKNIQESN